MSYGRGQHMAAVEQCGEDYVSGEIDADDFKRKMKHLGFEPMEIQDHLDALEDDRNCDGIITPDPSVVETGKELY